MMELLLAALLQFNTLFGPAPTESAMVDTTASFESTSTTVITTTTTTTEAGGHGWGEGH